MTTTAHPLPDDIVQEILKYFAAPLLTLIDGSAHEFPWYLDHVCSSWRVAFLSMHKEFWTKFLLYPAISRTRKSEQRCTGIWRVAFLSMHKEFWKKFLLYPAICRTRKSEQRCADIAAAFMERSNGKPFSFEIHRNSRSRLVLGTFMREVTRWQDVSLAIKEEEIPLLEPVKGRLSQLRSLTLVVTPAHWAAEECYVPQSCNGIFTDAPLLTHVRLSDLSTWQFNWSSLIALDLIKPVPNSYLLRLLPHMQNLERLLVNQPHNVHSTYFGVKSISLPRLRVLTIFGFGLLPLLVSPSLTELYIDVEAYNPGWKIAPAVRVCASFFQRSSCTIQRLGIRSPSSDEIMQQILLLTPNLRFLSIDDDGWQLKLLARMGSRQPRLVPGMQSLRITFPTTCTEPPVLLLSFIVSRTAKSIPLEYRLKELIVVVQDSADLEYISLLRGLGPRCRECNSDIEIKIVSTVGPNSDLGRISGEYDRVL